MTLQTRKSEKRKVIKFTHNGFSLPNGSSRAANTQSAVMDRIPVRANTNTEAMPHTDTADRLHYQLATMLRLMYLATNKRMRVFT